MRRKPDVKLNPKMSTGKTRTRWGRKGESSPPPNAFAPTETSDKQNITQQSDTPAGTASGLQRRVRLKPNGLVNTDSEEECDT